MASDPVESKQAEALARSEAMLARTEAIAEVGSWEWHVATDTATWSAELFRLFGRNLAEGAPSLAEYVRLHDSADQPKLERAVEAAVRDGTPYELALRAIRSDGTRRVFLARGHAELGPGGTATRLFGSVQDITELRRVEDALRASEAMFSLAFKSSPAAITLARVSDGRFLEVNDAFSVITGYTREEAVGRTSAQLGIMVEADRSPLLSSMREGRALTGREMQFRRKNGEVFPVMYSAQPIEVGGEPCLISSTNDLSERKQLETRLYQSDRLASVGLLAGGLGHEINNPLTYVLANSATLCQELPKLVDVTRRLSAALSRQGPSALAAVLGDDAQVLDAAALQDLVECAQSALEGARRIQAVSRRLGAFSRIERGRLEPLDLHLAIESAIAMTSNEVKYRASVVTDFGEVPRVLASEGKLSQVFLNLIVNAAHAFDDGPVNENRITIRTWARGDDVFAEVADNGPGLPADSVGRIFEPFTALKFGKGAGLGLGLSICRNIVAEFGGDIRVESELGKGTRFILRLPANRANAAPKPSAAVVSPPGVVRGRILVVDDEEEIRKTLLRVLGPRHEVITVASGSEAKALLERDGAFDVILCDLMMPQMTGMELHAWLAANAPALATRVVFITGGAFTDSASDYLASVTSLTVAKPFDLAALEKLVSDFIPGPARALEG